MSPRRRGRAPPPVRAAPRVHCTRVYQCEPAAACVIFTDFDQRENRRWIPGWINPKLGFGQWQSAPGFLGKAEKTTNIASHMCGCMLRAVPNDSMLHNYSNTQRAANPSFSAFCRGFGTEANCGVFVILLLDFGCLLDLPRGVLRIFDVNLTEKLICTSIEESALHENIKPGLEGCR